MTGCPEWVRTLNLWTDRVMHADPYPRYAELRSTCPVAWSDELGGHWVVTRHADIVRVLQDPETFSAVTQVLPPSVDLLGIRIPGEVDGPEHNRYRQALLPMFAPKYVAALEPTGRGILDRLLGEVDPSGFEFVSTVATPYVFDMVMALFGIEPEHYDAIRAWEDGGLRKKPHDPVLTAQVGGFLGDRITDRRDHPKPEPVDLLDHLANADLTLDEGVRLAVFALKAGLHTTVNALSNCVAFLAEHLEVRDLLVAQPERVSEVLEELMRLDSILVITRTATRDTEVAGQPIALGDHLILLTGSASRDEAVFADAATFDASRENSAHLMFGSGPHRCLGRHFARSELRVALEELHRLLPTYRLDPDRPPKRYTAMSRGAKEIHLLA
jgi:cytochrome P450